MHTFNRIYAPTTNSNPSALYLHAHERLHVSAALRSVVHVDVKDACTHNHISAATKTRQKSVRSKTTENTTVLQRKTTRENILKPLVVISSNYFLCVLLLNLRDSRLACKPHFMHTSSACQCQNPVLGSRIVLFLWENYDSGLGNLGLAYYL